MATTGLTTTIKTGWLFSEDDAFVSAVPAWQNPVPAKLSWHYAGDVNAYLDALAETLAAHGADRPLPNVAAGDECRFAEDLALIQEAFTSGALCNNLFYEPNGSSYAEHFSKDNLTWWHHFCIEAGLVGDAGWGFAYAASGTTEAVRPETSESGQPEDLRTCTEGDAFILPELMSDLLNALNYVRSIPIKFHSPTWIASQTIEPFSAADTILQWAWGDGNAYLGEGESDPLGGDTAGNTLEEAFEQAQDDHLTTDLGAEESTPVVALETKAKLNINSYTVGFEVELTGAADVRDLEFTPLCNLGSYDIWGKATKGTADVFSNDSWTNITESLSIMLSGLTTALGAKQSRRIGIAEEEIDPLWYPEPEDLELTLTVTVSPAETTVSRTAENYPYYWSVTGSVALNGVAVPKSDVFTYGWTGDLTEHPTNPLNGYKWVYPGDYYGTFSVSFGEDWSDSAQATLSATLLEPCVDPEPDDPGCEDPETDEECEDVSIDMLCSNPEVDEPGCTTENPDDGCTTENPDDGCTTENPDDGCTTENPDDGCTSEYSEECTGESPECV
jgi:hypothetical protein